jgi:K+-transporting ATPase ATPase C chain
VGSILRRELWPPVGILLMLTLVTGILYPATVTLIGQVAFHRQANGSLIEIDGRVVGSSLIGQAFGDPAYFWSRPSAAGDGYDANASSGSNLAPTSRELLDRIEADVRRLRAANGNAAIPVDLVTASASGLDPDISPEAATYQAPRVAAARGMTLADVQAAIDRHTALPFLGFIGEPAVNVLELNLDLDGLTDD